MHFYRKLLQHSLGPSLLCCLKEGFSSTVSSGRGGEGVWEEFVMEGVRCGKGCSYTSILALSHTHICAHACACTRTRIHTHTHTHTHTCTHTHTHTHTHIHTCTHTYTHTLSLSLSHTHTHIHMHIQPNNLMLWFSDTSTIYWYSIWDNTHILVLLYSSLYTIMHKHQFSHILCQTGPPS